MPPWLHDPSKPLHKGMISTVHDAIAEGDLENFLEGKVRPYRVRKVPTGLEDFIGAEGHARSHSHPFLHRSFGSFCCRPMPFILAPVGRRQFAWPDVQCALPVAGGEQRRCREFARKSLSHIRREKVYLSVFLDLDDGGRCQTILWVRMDPHEVLTVWFAHGDGG